MTLEVDSQSKEALTTAVSDFGSACEMPESFVNRVARIPGLRDLVRNDRLQKDTKELNRQLGTNKVRWGGSWPWPWP